jgi:uncharacterized membrane protein
MLFSMLTAIYVKEEDIATYTIKAADDPTTLNKILYLRPLANTLSFNEIVSLWEKKIGKTLKKIYLLEDQVLEKIQGESNNNFTRCCLVFFFFFFFFY